LTTIRAIRKALGHYFSTDNKRHQRSPRWCPDKNGWRYARQAQRQAASLDRAPPIGVCVSVNQQMFLRHRSSPTVRQMEISSSNWFTENGPREIVNVVNVNAFLPPTNFRSATIYLQVYLTFSIKTGSDVHLITQRWANKRRVAVALNLSMA